MRQTSATDRDYSVLNFRQFKGECLKGSILTRGYRKYSLAYAVNLNNYVRSNTDNVFGEGVFFVCLIKLANCLHLFLKLPYKKKFGYFYLLTLTDISQ